MGNLWRCCVTACDAIELPFVVVSRVVPRIGALDGVQITRGQETVCRVLMTVGYQRVFQHVCSAGTDTHAIRVRKVEDFRLSNISVDPCFKALFENVEIVVDYGPLRSSATEPFDRAHTTSYSTLIETMRLYCTVFDSELGLFVESGHFNPPLRRFGAPVGGDPVRISPRFLASETRLAGLSCGVQCVMRCLDVLIQYRRVTGRQTGTRRQQSQHTAYRASVTRAGKIWEGMIACGTHRARQLYTNISMLFLFPVKDGRLSTGVNATFDASCYG